MTTADAAALLKIHRNNLLKALRNQWMPGVKFSGVWVVRRADVLEYQQRTSKRKGKGLTEQPNNDKMGA